MYTPAEVANYFALKGIEEANYKDQLSLQKLTFIAHGWHLALTDKPLVNELAQAWLYGPVYESLYRKLKPNKARPLTTPLLKQAPPFTPDEQDFLALVWAKYKDWSSSQLVTATHQPESPWSRWYLPFFSAEIPNEDVKAHYKKLNENARLY